MCKSCKKNTPIIDFENKTLEKIFYSCKCSYKSKVGIPQVVDFNWFFLEESEKGKEYYDKYMKCNKHNNNDTSNSYRKYIGYCNNLKQNVCKDCIDDKHSKEDISYFDDLLFKIDKNIEHLIKIY